MRTRFLVVTALLLGAVVPVRAQSVFNAAGLGLPVEALDGRARAMGNLGIGLGDASLMPTDPAAMASYVIPTGIMASQPTWADYAEEGGASGTFQGNRFPLMGIAYPLFSGMMSIQIGAFLDQHFTSEDLGSVDLGGIPVGTTDVFEQDGAVSTVSFGYARRLGEASAVGLTVGRYAGVEELHLGDGREYDRPGSSPML